MKVFYLLQRLLALLLLFLFSPLLLAIALVVRLRLGAPVFFRHQRPGLYGRPFELIKFRSMTQQRDARGSLLPDEQRLTPIGKLLRISSLDELPELLNIVRGEMAFVGPRPLLMEYLPLYSAEQARRHHVRPGITGWAQVHGRNSLSWEEKFRLDIWYVDNQNPALDLYIILMTIVIVLRRQGISAPGQATMSPFTGS